MFAGALVVLILNVPFQHDLSACEMELQKTETRGRPHRVLSRPILCYTHTGAVLQSDSSLQIDPHTQRAASEQTDVTV